jgi:hypothetical protein
VELVLLPEGSIHWVLGADATAAGDD